MNKIKNIFIILTIVLFTAACNDETVLKDMTDTWQNCNSDMAKAARIAGFELPLDVQNYKVRASKNFLEVKFNYEGKDITVRKTENTDFADISGDYSDYPVKGEIVINKDVTIWTLGDGEKIYTANFSDFDYDYSINDKKGMSEKEVKAIYQLIGKAEKK